MENIDLKITEKTKLQRQLNVFVHFLLCSHGPVLTCYCSTVLPRFPQEMRRMPGNKRSHTDAELIKRSC